MKNSSILQALMGGGVGLVAYMNDLNWILIVIWFIVVALDIISGVLKGIVLEWKSREFTMGILFKAFQAILVFALILLNFMLIEMGYDFHLSSIIIGAFIFKDVVSIAENGSEMGYEMPSFVTTLFNKVQAILDQRSNDVEEGDGK